MGRAGVESYPSPNLILQLEETDSVGPTSLQGWNQGARVLFVPGGRVYVQDDGGIVDTPLALRVPEVAAELVAEHTALKADVHRIEQEVLKLQPLIGSEGFLQNDGQYRVDVPFVVARTLERHQTTFESMKAALIENRALKARVEELEKTQRTEGTVEVCLLCRWDSSAWPEQCGGISDVRCPIRHSAPAKTEG